MKKAYILLKDFEPYVEKWLSMRINLGYKLSSNVAAKKDIGSFVRFCHESNVMRIDGNTVIQYIHWLKNVRGNNSGAINRKQSSLRCYINQLRLKQVKGALQLPMEYLPRARAAYPGPIKTLEPQEVKAILNSFDKKDVFGLRDFTFFNIQYSLGLRIGEVTKIDLKDIDFKEKLITIHGKGCRERVLPLIMPLIKIIRKWLKYRSSFLNSGNSPALFLSKKGNRLSQRTAQEHFQKAVTNAGPFGLEKVVPHTLRHAYASHSLETESDLLIIKYVLGHASLKSTEIYLHPSMKLLRKSAENHLACDMLKSYTCKVASRASPKKKSAVA